MRQTSRNEHLRRRLAGTTPKLKRSAISRRPPGVEVPLAWSQRRLYAIDRALGGTHLFNIPLAFQVAGALDREALANAVDALVDRHDILRTRIELNESGPLLRVCDENRVSLRLFVPEHNKISRETAVQEFLSQDADRIFDVEREPMFSARLLEIAPQDFVLSIVIHHLIADAFSVRNLLRELVVFYRAFASRTTPELAHLPIQFADYAYWQSNDGLRVSEPHLRYWADRLSGRKSADRPPLSATDLKTRRESVHIGAPIVSELLKLGAQEHATLFMTLLTALVVLVSHRSQSSDICMTTLVSNRQRPELEPLIGLLVNTIVLRLHVSASCSFRAMLGQVREETIAAYEHQELPFELLIHAAADAIRPSHIAGTIVFQNTPSGLPSIEGLAYSRLQSSENTDEEGVLTTFPFSLVLARSRSGMIGSIIYRQSCFSRDEVIIFLQAYQRFLQLAVASPDDSIASLLTRATTN